MATNKEIADFMLNKIEELGYKPYDVSYGNGYFIFEYGDNAVVHFRLKGVWKHWKFGMWIHSEYLSEKNNEYPFLQIFAQYDTQIDKFKPSASDLCVKFNASEWNETKKDNGLFLWELEGMLGMMKRHPFLCYDGLCGEYAGYHNRSFVWSFIKSEWYVYKQVTKKAIKTFIFLPYTKVKIYFAKKDKCVKSIELHDFEKENPGWITNYLYEVQIIFDEDSTDEEEIAWLDKWFRKEHYGKFGAFDCVVEVGVFQREGLDKPYSYTNL